METSYIFNENEYLNIDNSIELDKSYIESFILSDHLTEEEETEVIYQIGDNKIYTAVDNKLTEKSEKHKKEKKYSFLDIERLEAELKRINTSGSIVGIEMVERMLKEVEENVDRGKN